MSVGGLAANRWVQTLVLVVVLLVSFWPKTLCRAQLEAGDYERHWCYSDIKELWDIRGFDVQAVPYGDPPPGYEPYVFEYPPGLGFPAYGLARLADTPLGYFAVTAASLGLAAVLTLWALQGALAAVRRPLFRGMVFAASPTVLFFAFHNWDLWAVAPAMAGLLAASRRSPVLAGFLFGVAASVKWWPALLVLVLLWGPWATERTLVRRLAPACVAASAWLLVQLPAMAVSLDNWWAATAFHLQRPPNPDSPLGLLNGLLNQLAPGIADGAAVTALTTILTLGLMVAGTLVVLSRLHGHRLSPPESALALVVLFVLTSKVVSPQFVLWLVPLAALTAVPWRPLLAVEASNIAVWVLLAHGIRPLGIYGVFVIVRTLTLAWLLIVTIRVGREQAGTAGAIEARSG
jgi:uncharacterized membrane protein